MNIAFVVGIFPTLSETFILNQITGLIDLGHNVEIFALEQSRDEKHHADVLTYDLEKRVRYFDIPANRITRIMKAFFLVIKNFHRNPSKIVRSFNVFKYGRNALSLTLLYATICFLDKDFDIIFCHFGPMGTIGACLKQIGLKGKLITTLYGADLRLEVMKNKNFYKYLFETGDYFIAITRYHKKTFVRFGMDSQKILLHPVGIDLDKFDKRLPTVVKEDAPVRILTVARLVEEKGLEYGIKTIKRLLDRNPSINIRYTVIGGGPLEHSLITLTKDLGLTGIVSILGPMTQRGIIREMEKAHIFFLSSISETFGVVLLEAQAMGLPVVATNIGGVSEAFVDKKSGFLVPAKDVTAMAQKIEYLSNNQAKRRAMGAYGRKFVKTHYSIRDLNRKLNRVFAKIIKGNQ